MSLNIQRNFYNKIAYTQKDKGCKRYEQGFQKQQMSERNILSNIGWCIYDAIYRS